MTSAAGCINAQWKGAETDSMMARRLPFALAISIARSTAALSPEMTTCLAAVIVRGLTYLDPARLRQLPRPLASKSRPSSAAMAPSPDRNGLLHRAATNAHQPRCIRYRERAGRGQSRIFAK